MNGITNTSIVPTDRTSPIDIYICHSRKPNKIQFAALDSNFDSLSVTRSLTDRRWDDTKIANRLA